MKQAMFAIYDEKAAAFLPPFFMPNGPTAVRVFSDCVNDPKHQFGAHPTDYTLFKIGVFDSSTGVLEVLQRELIVNGVQVKRTPEVAGAQRDLLEAVK